VALAALLSAPAAATEGERDVIYEPVVPPGNEELLSDMLGRGAPLPDECKFAGGGADGPVIQSRYKCSSGEVVFELAHPTNIDKPATQTTEQFAVTLQKGSPPAGLVDVLVWLIRSRESDFEWAWLEHKVPAEDSDDAAE
jgi:hypothetical protein